MKLKNIFVRYSIMFLMLYFVFGLFLYFGQNSLLYYPNSQDFEDCPVLIDYEKVYINETRFYYLKGVDNFSVIVYYHGNAGSACDRGIFRNFFEESGKSVIFAEYSGYSNDDHRKPSKGLILEDVENINMFLKSNNYENLIVYGESIGATAGSYHTQIGNVSRLILISPFSNLKEVAQSKYRIYPASIMLKENYDNAKWLEDYKGEVIILHGERDMVIPKKFSRDLFDNINTDKKDYIIIEGKGHNNLWTSQEFIQKLRLYLS